MRRGLFFGLVIAISVVIADAVLFRQFLVPRLVQWPSVPVYWWFIVGGPLIFAIVHVGFRVAGNQQWIMASGTAAALSTRYRGATLFLDPCSGQPSVCFRTVRGHRSAGSLCAA